MNRLWNLECSPLPLFRVEVLEDDADLEDVLEVFLDDLVVPAIRLNFEGEENWY
jgi:hypothetical protein